MALLVAAWWLHSRLACVIVSRGCPRVNLLRSNSAQPPVMSANRTFLHQQVQHGLMLRVCQCFATTVC
jgi:hypothetical protein